MTPASFDSADFAANDADAAAQLGDVVRRSETERRRFYAGQPKTLAGVLARYLAQQSLSAPGVSEALQHAWQLAVGPALGQQSRPIRIRGGVLEVVVANSLVLQEVTMAKSPILTAIAPLLPEHRLTDLRLRVGKVRYA